MTRFSSISRRKFLGTAIAGGVLAACESSLRSIVASTERRPG
ncbi:MAG: twin-arginine translocation signal domain-containing protein [Komarekiella atlantica HA4396-MV6]|jgi:hypothetical protein|nr:twin-arginine translocation signal domain-containing protein [Komarekiella atlantica HA4396-MV6]